MTSFKYCDDQYVTRATSGRYNDYTVVSNILTIQMEWHVKHKLKISNVWCQVLCQFTRHIIKQSLAKSNDWLHNYCPDPSEALAMSEY